MHQNLNHLSTHEVISMLGNHIINALLWSLSTFPLYLKWLQSNVDHTCTYMAYKYFKMIQIALCFKFCVVFKSNVNFGLYDVESVELLVW